MCFAPRYITKLGYAVPCGKCFECREKKSEEWAFRLMAERSLHEQACMITLTYDDEHLPADRAVHKEDVQLFLKRLRERIKPKKVRVFYCGEYGERRGRPHYHVLLFGYDFPDRLPFRRDNKGTMLYRSPMLEASYRLWNGRKVAPLWDKGYSTIVAELTVEVCKYVALYLQKPPVDGRARPFVHMSNRPGIGADYVQPQALVTDKLVFGGKWIKLPRYFLNVLERRGVSVGFVKERRAANAWHKHRWFLANYQTVFGQVAQRIRRIEKIFGRPLDKNKSV